MIIKVAMSERDARLLDIHSELYSFAMYETTGKTWKVVSPDYDESFPTYKSFIKFIEEEVKNALLQYALDGELKEIAEV